jgi:ankyrin repeat protein
MDNQELAGHNLWWTVEMGGGNHSEKVEVVQAMVEEWGNNGEVINYGFPGKHHSTPLWQAVANGYLDIVQILLEAKSIDVNKAPTSGWAKGKSPLDIALEERKRDEDYEEIVKVLKKAGAKASKTKGGAKKRKSNKNLNKSAKKSKSKHNKTQKTKSK